MEKNYKVNDNLTLEMDGRTYRLTKNKLNNCGHCPLHKIQGCGELCGTTYYKAAEAPSFDYSDAIFVEVDESKETAMKKDEIDYKALYEETISKLKSAKENVGCYTFSEVIDKVIPEVADSEDEKIRKELIEFVKSRGAFKQEYIAWLQKHKEQKTTWDEDDEKMLILCASSVRTRYNDGLLTDEEYEQASSWLKSRKDRMAWRPTEEQMEALGDAVKLYKTTHFGSQHYKIETLYNDLKKL